MKERQICEEFISQIDQLVALNQLSRFDVLHINNGEHSGTQRQCMRANAKANRMGQRKGVADYLVFGRHFLEAKTKRGILSEDQRAFRAWCEARGIEYRVFRSVREGVDLVIGWQESGILK
jgi:hypothetical protein